jgi:hypothetical protein
MLHLNWSNTRPLKVNYRCNLPVAVDENITLMKVGKRQDKWSVAKVAIRKVPKKSPHNRQS